MCISRILSIHLHWLSQYIYCSCLHVSPHDALNLAIQGTPACLEAPPCQLSFQKGSTWDQSIGFSCCSSLQGKQIPPYHGQLASLGLYPCPYIPLSIHPNGSLSSPFQSSSGALCHSLALISKVPISSTALKSPRPSWPLLKPSYSGRTSPWASSPSSSSALPRNRVGVLLPTCNHECSFEHRWIILHLSPLPNDRGHNA